MDLGCIGGARENSVENHPQKIIKERRQDDTTKREQLFGTILRPGITRKVQFFIVQSCMLEAEICL